MTSLSLIMSKGLEILKNYVLCWQFLKDHTDLAFVGLSSNTNNSLSTLSFSLLINCCKKLKTFKSWSNFGEVHESHRPNMHVVEYIRIARKMKLKIVLLLNLYGQHKEIHDKKIWNLHLMSQMWPYFYEMLKIDNSNYLILCHHSMNWSFVHNVNGIIMLLMLLMTAMSSVGMSNQPLMNNDWVYHGWKLTKCPSQSILWNWIICYLGSVQWGQIYC